MLKKDSPTNSSNSHDLKCELKSPETMRDDSQQDHRGRNHQRQKTASFQSIFSSWGSFLWSIFNFLVLSPFQNIYHWIFKKVDTNSASGHKNSTPGDSHVHTPTCSHGEEVKFAQECVNISPDGTFMPIRRKKIKKNQETQTLNEDFTGGMDMLDDRNRDSPTI